MVGKSCHLFLRGYYCYVGSAQVGLESRLKRHQSRTKRPHWHIDYLLRHARVVGIATRKGSRDECGLSDEVKAAGGELAVKKFGSTDCRCETHLHYFQKNPSKKISNLPNVTISFK